MLMKQILLAIGLIVFLPAATRGAEWSADLGPGSALPAINASDQAGQPQDNKSLAGDKGLLLLFNRSVVW